MTEEELLRQFTRELMGSSVAHINDDELDTWMRPWRELVESNDPPGPARFPAWFIKSRDEARVQLLTVLTRRR